MISKLKVTCNSCVALGCALILLATAGCSCFPKLQQFHQTALSHFPPRSALRPPAVMPYYAKPAFFGYHGTCWYDWPEGWIDCPCSYIEEIPIEEEVILAPDAENVPVMDPAESRAEPASALMPLPKDRFPAPDYLPAIAPAPIEAHRPMPFEAYRAYLPMPIEANRPAVAAPGERENQDVSSRRGRTN